MKKVRFLHWTYFIWTLVPLSVVAFVHVVGIPSVLWSYEWNAHGGNGYSQVSQRYYTRCTYVGPHGSVSEYPVNGQCGWLHFPAPMGARP